MNQLDTSLIDITQNNNPSSDLRSAFDDTAIYALLNCDSEKTIDVTKPQSPNVFWTLVTNYRGSGSIPLGELQEHRNYINLRNDYFSHLNSQGIKVKPNTLDLLGDSCKEYPNNTQPSVSDIILMMDDCITDLSKEANLKGTISIVHADFAKICINYSPESEFELENGHNAVIGSVDAPNTGTGAHVIINALNSDLMFDPTYKASFSPQVTQGKLYADNDLFTFVSVVEKALRQCFFHLLRLTLLERNNSIYNFANKLVPAEFSDSYVVCDKEGAAAFVAHYVDALETYLDTTNQSERAAWVPISYIDLSVGKHQTKHIRLFAFKPTSKDGKKLKPLLYVEYNPSVIGTPPSFTKEAQAILDSYDGEQFTQNNDVSLLIEQITNNAIPKELKGKHHAIPTNSLLHYWFVGLYSPVRTPSLPTQEPYQIISTQLREATKHINAKPVGNAEEPMSFSHLFWMLDEISSGSMNETKSSRWLGYVYSILRSKQEVSEITTLQLKSFNEFNGEKHHTHRLRSSVEITEGYLVEADEMHGSIEFSVDDDSLPNLYAILRHVHGSLLTDMTANFWIGYVQGCMVVKGMLNVNEERERTRSIFNGY
ncbi:hypothetical protein OTK49_02550 [Vibrio coralliirubri]|uniref:hypothetical protein n=1 Tax=Vibrio coralliirubri TaxID=1516159 RepID=UPI002283FCC1|nr:hypothetical protein [Vibrio coralliirubri]MCY9861397.1 hypothetical protein [Vibrio coralliirubri]